jgi:hypothetical protein
MYAYNVTDRDLQDAAVACSFCLVRGNDKGRGKNFRIFLAHGSTKEASFAGWSTDAWGNVRRKSSVNVCIHGHYLFFKYLIRINPQAEIVTAWYGRVRITKNNLDEWYNDLAHRYTNSMMTHTFGSRCACEREQMWHLLDNIHKLPLEPGNEHTTHYDLVKVSRSD